MIVNYTVLELLAKNVQSKVDIWKNVKRREMYGNEGLYNHVL